MEKRHLRLIPIVLSASLFTFSCVDNDYDLTDDIDLTIQVGGSEFAIPGGETEPILLSKILDIEEDGVVKTDEYGNYYLWQEGSETTIDISVDDFEINSPDINPINQVLNFNLPSIGGVQENLPPITLDEMTTNFKLDGTELPKEIKSLSLISMDMEAVVHFSFEPAIAENLYLEVINLQFPEFIQSSRLTHGLLQLENEKANRIDGLSVTVPIDGIDCRQDGVRFEGGNILIEGNISLTGEVTINTGEILVGEGPASVTLKVDITLQDKQTKKQIIKIKSIVGKVEPDIDITIDPVTISGLPDFLDDERVTLSVEKPMIFFTANNNTPVAAQVKGEITSYITKDNQKEQLGDPVNHPVKFDFTINKETEEKFCLLPPDVPTDIEGVTTFVEVENLPTLISRIPDLFEFEVTAEAIQAETEIQLNHTYGITTDYDVNVPFVFGKDVTQIVYKDSVDGWYEDLKDYEIKQVNATATAVNKIPLGLNFTAKALTVDAQGNPEELKGVTVTVKVDGEKDGIIKAGKNNVAAESALVIEIKETTAGAVKKLDGLAFEIVAASGTDAQGQQLNENQTLQLKNVRLKVPGGAIVDLN